MKKILLSAVIAIFAFGSATEVTTISKKVTKDSLIFAYDVPDKSFNEFKSKPDFFKQIAINILCKKDDTRMLSNSMNIIYDYKKHSDNKDEVVIKIKKGVCDRLK